MKKIILMSLGLLLLPPPSLAFSGVVTDPTSYTYYAQQIKQATDYIKVMQDQLKTTQQIQSSLTGNLGRGAGFSRELSRLRDYADSMTKKIMKPANLSNMNDLDFEKELDLEKYIKSIFRPDTDYMSVAKSKPERERYQRYVMESSLKAAERSLAEQASNLDDLENMGAQIDRTQTQKDALDLQNRYMAKMLSLQLRQIELLAQISRAVSAQNLIGNEGLIDESKGFMDKVYDSSDRYFDQDAVKRGRERLEKWGW